jgi:hypothetical protein
LRDQRAQGGVGECFSSRAVSDNVHGRPLRAVAVCPPSGV